MIRRLAATALLTATLGAVSAALLPGIASADSICVGGDNQRRPGATTLCIVGVPHTEGGLVPVPL